MGRIGLMRLNIDQTGCGKAVLGSDIACRLLQSIPIRRESGRGKSGDPRLTCQVKIRLPARQYFCHRIRCIADQQHVATCCISRLDTSQHVADDAGPRRQPELVEVAAHADERVSQTSDLAMLDDDDAPVADLLGPHPQRVTRLATLDPADGLSL